MIEATCSACGTVNRIAEGDVPAGAKFLTCTSCKSRIALSIGAKAAPKAAAIPPMPKPPAIPGAKPTPDLTDLPAPRRQSALAGLESSKPAPRSGLDLVDLPAPKTAKSSGGMPPLELDDLGADLPAPKGRGPLDVADLPAPKTGKAPPVAAKSSPNITDLPAPKARSPLADLPAPKSKPDIADLPAPKPKTPPSGVRATPPVAIPSVKPPAPRMPTPPAPTPVAAPPSSEPLDIVDLPAPKGPSEIVDLPAPKSGGIDLPAPKGFFDDLPQPARAATPGLPAPKGFFEDLPQPAKAGAPSLPAPKGFFDDLPQPSKPGTPSVPAPKGFFDDLPQPSAVATPSPPVQKPATIPPPTKPASKAFFDEEPTAAAAPEYIEAARRGVFDDLPEPTRGLELGASGGGELDLGLPSPGGKGDFGELDLSLPSAPPPPAAAKSGITIKTPSKPPGSEAGHVDPSRNNELALDLEEVPAKIMQAPPLAIEAPPPPAKPLQKPKAAKPEKAAKPSGGSRKLLLGGFVAVALAGAGGFFMYQRYQKQQQRKADFAEHLKAAQAAIHSDNPNHWTRAAGESKAALDLDDENPEAIGLRAESLFAGALDTGVGMDGKISQGRHLLADALEHNITGPQLEAAQALGMVAANQADRALIKLDEMTKRDPKNGFWRLYLGWAYVAKGDPASAVKAFDAAIAADPKTKLPALYARGRAKLQLLDLEGAKADFAAVLELSKDHIGAQVGLAAALPLAQSSQREADLLAILARKDIATGDPRAVVQAWTLAADTARLGGRLDVARERYRNGLAVSKLDVPALVGLARVELKDGKLSIAADLVQKALSQAGDNPDALLVSAELAIRQNKLPDAATTAQKLAARQPPLPPAQRANLQLVLGYLLEAQGKDDDAVDAWIEGAKVAGDLDLSPTMTAVTKLGVLAKKAADNHDAAKASAYRDRADELLSALAGRAQDDPQLSKALGAAYLGADDAVKAEHFLRRSVEMRGNDIESRLELSKALVKLDRTDDALEQLRAAQQLEPTRLDIALEIARTLESAKRDAAAEEAYTKLLAQKDVPVQARVHAGRFFARKGDIKRAAEQAEPILQAEPDNPAGHYLKGEGLIALSKLDDARRELMTAVDGDPDPQYLDAQGRAAEASVLSTGDTKYYDLALRAYERAVEAAPQMFNPQAGMGRIYTARKEWTKAIPPLVAANKIEPQDPAVMFDLGISYKNVGQPSVAVDWFVAAARDKQDADTWWQLGQLYQDANRGAEAAKAFHEATRLGRERETKAGTKVEWLTDAWYRLGQTEYDLHHAKEAKAAFEQFVGRNPPADVRLKTARELLNTELKGP